MSDTHDISDAQRDKAAPTLWRSVNKTIDFITGDFFMPLAFTFGGAGMGGYLMYGSSVSLLTAVIVGAILGFCAWLAVQLLSWFS